MLRYIDAVDFDHVAGNSLDFLRDKMRVQVALPPELFGSDVEYRPALLNWHTAFPCRCPTGMVSLRLATGQREGRPAIIWETVVHSAGTDTPSMPDGFGTWLSASHGIVHRWFMTLIQGELMRRFSGE
jgi:uncharacterized protein (TIGR04255 family)